MITTSAWVLYKDTAIRGLVEEEFSFPDIEEHEVLAEPIYGCWEGNMTHAIDRKPINIALVRREPKVVIGNAGVVRVVKVGASVTNVRAGETCIFTGGSSLDAYGYSKSAHGYDARNSVGLLAKKMKADGKLFFPIPENTKHSLEQWAGFSLRYLTAWSNWHVANKAFRIQTSIEDLAAPHVWGWGGGTTLAELDLAKRMGCSTHMISGSDQHLEQIASMGIGAIDRREFASIDPQTADKKSYLKAIKAFLATVKEKTANEGVSIFIDYIGSPVYNASLRALGRQGVITTAGWKLGMELSTNRASECISRHIHVYTHGWRFQEIPDAMQYAETENWMPEIGKVWSWNEIPKLAKAHKHDAIDSYFPIFNVN